MRGGDFIVPLCSQELGIKTWTTQGQGQVSRLPGDKHLSVLGTLPSLQSTFRQSQKEGALSPAWTPPSYMYSISLKHS